MQVYLMQTNEFAKSEQEKINHLLYTDSLSSGQTISKIYNKSSMNIHQLIEKRLWIPSHVGIQGNDEADEMAKDAQSNFRAVILLTPDTCGVIKDHQKELWTSEWSNTTKANKLRAIKDSREEWPSLKEGKYPAIISRLRVGHTCVTH